VAPRRRLPAPAPHARERPAAGRARRPKATEMAHDQGVPHFHNDPGVTAIHVGSREFMCIGARPPFDHPHVFIDMGRDDEVICSYCGTLYKFKPTLSAGEAEPAACIWDDREAAA